jgi:hypothetical protein
MKVASTQFVGRPFWPPPEAMAAKIAALQLIFLAECNEHRQ